MAKPLNFRQDGTSNAVKLLPIIKDINNYIGLTTELDSHIKIGDIIFITHRYSGDTSCALDNYLNYYHENNYPYLNYVNGYKVIDTQIENNLIIINKQYDKSLDNCQLSEHYVSTKSADIKHIDSSSFNYVTVADIDSVLFKNTHINNTTSNYINIKQAYILAGTINNVHFKNKYDFKYLSLNSSSTGSTYSYNNNNYGYTYCHGLSNNYININNSLIDNGWFYYNNISATTINGGYFEYCNVSATTINNGYFRNCILNDDCIWNNGNWDYKLSDPSGISFGCLSWSAGTWQNGVFGTGKTWSGGTFYNGTFYGIWLNGDFNGTKSVTTSGTTYNGNFLGTWINGTFNGGKFGKIGTDTYIWTDGTVNGGDFFYTNWLNGTFNNANFYYGNWYNGTFNSGNFSGITGQSYWYQGIFNSGTMSNTGWADGKFKSGDMYNVIFSAGTFYSGDFINSIFLSGRFKSGNITNSTWMNGICEYAIMENSYWENGDWYDGVVYNSNFLNVNWSGGTFNSGKMLYSGSSTGAWYGGNFNGGTFGYSVKSPLNNRTFELYTPTTSIKPNYLYYRTITYDIDDDLIIFNNSNDIYAIYKITSITNFEDGTSQTSYGETTKNLSDIKFWKTHPASLSPTEDYLNFDIPRQQNYDPTIDDNPLDGQQST
jgi:hypothetical protein